MSSRAAIRAVTRSSMSCRQNSLRACCVANARLSEAAAMPASAATPRARKGPKDPHVPAPARKLPLLLRCVPLHRFSGGAWFQRYRVAAGIVRAAFFGQIV